MNKTLQNIFIIAGTVLAMYVGYFLADGWFSAKYETPTAFRDTTPATIIQPKVDTQVTPDTFKQDYISGCTPDGLNKTYCECGYEYMVGIKGKEWLVKESIAYYQSGRMSDELGDAMIGAVEKCL